MYTYNIESFVQKVCMLAREKGEDHQRRCLRASSLQCLSAMVVLQFDYSVFILFFKVLVFGGWSSQCWLFNMSVPWQVWFMAEFSHIFVDFDEVSSFRLSLKLLLLTVQCIFWLLK